MGPENQVVRLGLHADDRAVDGSVASAETRAAGGARRLGAGLWEASPCTRARRAALGMWSNVIGRCDLVRAC